MTVYKDKCYVHVAKRS